jgi:hAT family C-terminal dimerisation region
MSRENILQPIRTAMDNYKDSTTPIVEEDTVQDLRHQLKNLSTSETRNYFRNLFMPDQNSQSIANELDTYFDINSPNFEVIPLEWWKVHSSEYPILSQMAKDYLTIMSTSVPCEQLFSIAGKQITQTRNRLHSDTTQACLCLKSWLEQEIIK